MKAIQLPADADAALIYGVAGAAVPQVSWEHLLAARPKVAILIAGQTRTLEGWAGDLRFLAQMMAERNADTESHGATATHNALAKNAPPLHQTTQQPPRLHKANQTPPRLHFYLLPEPESDLGGDDPRAFEHGCDRLATLTALNKLKEAEAAQQTAPLKQTDPLNTQATGGQSGNTIATGGKPIAAAQNSEAGLSAKSVGSGAVGEESAQVQYANSRETQAGENGPSDDGVDDIHILLVTPAALGQSVPAPHALRERQLRLRVGETRSFEELVRLLPERLGYDHEALCESPGQYAVRGGLIDIYPLNAEAPVRIDFFGDEIESIRPFDPTTQRSDAGDSLASVTIAAAAELDFGAAMKAEATAQQEDGSEAGQADGISVANNDALSGGGNAKRNANRDNLQNAITPNDAARKSAGKALATTAPSAINSTRRQRSTSSAARRHTVLDYLPQSGVCWYLREPAVLAGKFPEIFAVPEKIAPPRNSFSHVVAARAQVGDTWLGICQLDEAPPLFNGATRIERDTESLEPYAVRGETRLLGIARVELEQGARSRLFERLTHWQNQGHVIHCVGRTEAEIARLEDILHEDKAAHGLRPHFHVGELGEGFRIGGTIIETDDVVTTGANPATAEANAETATGGTPNAAPEAANAATGGAAKKLAQPIDLSSAAAVAGSAATEAGGNATRSLPQTHPQSLALAFAASHPAVFVTEAEIFGRKRLRITSARKRRLPERKAVEQALDFSELVDGDTLVHLQNGICIFRGLQKLELKGRQEEVITLEFDEGVHLHLRLHESHLLSRYVGLSKISPKLGRLGTNSWEKARSGVERATLDFAAELLRMQAERDALPGFAFPQDVRWQHEFEAAFPYTETPDQLKAINDTKTDMEREHPMDRLICGDVGFGKTEVAIRAAFKAVLAGKQVALLIPTTVLCLQHFKTFKERFADYPVVVEMLSRFRTPKQRTEIIRQLKTGKIDIVVGTHALLAKNVVFRDLGLLIIDEEHRFGVRQKEQLKHLKANVDVVSMSATPIPRTLYFALMGARDLSVIETPPRERRPIETVVKAYDPQLVRNAIKSEIDRGGQIFYLHNRVQTIDAVASRLRELVPDARIGVGHGQMAEGALEKLMADFVDGRYDVLVCTTIIESGLDIPNCNTIIIEGADRFGLSQLYQLRGRVGRFNRQAYCYLLLHRHGHLLDIARKRLGAIRQYNQLGAGFRIAMRDLELRGAGNLLGSKQHGPIATVGFDLYCQLLRQSVARLKGESPAKLIRAIVRLDFVIVGQASETEAPMQLRYGMRPEDSVLALPHKAARDDATAHHGKHGGKSGRSGSPDAGSGDSGRHSGDGGSLHAGSSGNSGSDSNGGRNNDASDARNSGALDRVSSASHSFEKFRESSEVKIGYHALRATDKQAKSVAPVEAYLPVGYIAEARLRIDFYRRLAQAADIAELTAISEQMADRFGPLPPPVEVLLRWTEIRIVAEQKGIALVESDAERLKCQLAKSGPPQFLKVGDRFPRLTAATALSRMREILTFLKRQHDTP